MYSIVNKFLPLAHEVDYITDASYVNKFAGVKMFLVDHTLSGNVTITLLTNTGSTIGDISTVHTFSANAFTQGQIYQMSVKSVSYAHSTDRSNPPLIGLL